MPLLGLEAAGKSTIVQGLVKPGDQSSQAPTIGFNVEKKKIGSVELCMLDVGGSSKVRDLWIHYLEDSAAVIYVVDAADTDKFEEIADLIRRNSEYPCMKFKPVLVLANKQDLEDAFSAEDVEQKLGLSDALGDYRPWKCMPVSGKTKDGVLEAFTWLSNVLDDSKIHPASKYKPQSKHSDSLSNIADTPLRFK